MKNLAATLFLMIVALIALSAAAAAKTTYDDGFNAGSRVESTELRENANSDLVNSFLNKPTCWLVWRFSDGQEIPVRIPCPKKGK